MCDCSYSTRYACGVVHGVAMLRNYGTGMSDHKLLQAKDVFKAAGFDCWETVIGSCGVSLHSVTVKLTS